MNKCVIFDMDGTVYDSIADLANSVNYALERCNIPTHEIESYKNFLGEGVFTLIRKAITESYYNDEIFDKVKHEYEEHYKKNLNDLSKPYEGIIPMLNKLKESGIKIAICSNKPHAFCVDICDTSFKDVFDFVLGQSSERPKKPNPSMLFKIIEQLDSDSENAIYVGDSGIDIMAGKNANIKTIGVTYGFRTREELVESGAEYLCDNVEQLEKTIEKLLV